MKRIKISPGIEVGIFVLDKNIVTCIDSVFPPADLVNDRRTCGIFGLLRDGQWRSLANKAASRMFTSAATEHETNALKRHNNESEIGLLHQLDSLRGPLEFVQLIGNDINYALAEIMSRGRPSTKFNISRSKDGYFVRVKIIRPLPGWNDKDLDKFHPDYVKLYQTAQAILDYFCALWTPPPHSLVRSQRYPGNTIGAAKPASLMFLHQSSNKTPSASPRRAPPPLRAAGCLAGAAEGRVQNVLAIPQAPVAVALIYARFRRILQRSKTLGIHR